MDKLWYNVPEIWLNLDFQIISIKTVWALPFLLSVIKYMYHYNVCYQSLNKDSITEASFANILRQVINYTSN